MENTVLIRPCGAGKTTQACEYAAIEAARGRNVLYVVPTRALLLEVVERLRSFGARVEVSAGRSTRKEPVNCRNPLADLSQAAGFSLLAFCQTCPFFNSCDYTSGRFALTLPGTVRVMTFAFLVWNRSLVGQHDVVIYDEMPKWVEIKKDHLPLLPEPHRSSAVRLESLPRIVRKEIRRYYAGSGAEPPAAFLLPSLPRGRERTIVLTATPIPGLLEAMLGAELVYDAAPNFWGVDQLVRWSFIVLPHSREWTPQADGCGFKKNTLEGWPYFAASIGQNRWRGWRLKAFGTFQPPPHVWLVVASLLRARLKIDPVDAVFDRPPRVDPLGLARRMRIPTWTISFEINEKVIPIPWLARVGELAQLLGRSGIGVENFYAGSIPIAARNTVWGYRFAREIELEEYEPRDVALEILTHFHLFSRSPLDASIHAWPELALVADERMIVAARQRAASIRSLVTRFNEALGAGGGRE